MNKNTYEVHSTLASFASVALEEFHSSYEIPNDKQQKNLRLSLIKEEYKEVKKVLDTTRSQYEEIDRSALAKELADLLYVTYGTALVFNIDLDTALLEVHKSNMSKLGDDGKPIRREDGKILKGKNYKEPDMSKALL